MRWRGYCCPKERLSGLGIEKTQYFLLRVLVLSPVVSGILPLVVCGESVCFGNCQGGGFRTVNPPLVDGVWFRQTGGPDRLWPVRTMVVGAGERRDVDRLSVQRFGPVVSCLAGAFNLAVVPTAEDGK